MEEKTQEIMSLINGKLSEQSKKISEITEMFNKAKEISNRTFFWEEHEK